MKHKLDLPIWFHEFVKPYNSNNLIWIKNPMTYEESFIHFYYIKYRGKVYILCLSEDVMVHILFDSHFNIIFIDDDDCDAPFHICVFREIIKATKKCDFSNNAYPSGFIANINYYKVYEKPKTYSNCYDFKLCDTGLATLTITDKYREKLSFSDFVRIVKSCFEEKTSDYGIYYAEDLYDFILNDDA